MQHLLTILICQLHIYVHYVSEKDIPNIFSSNSSKNYPTFTILAQTLLKNEESKAV